MLIYTYMHRDIHTQHLHICIHIGVNNTTTKNYRKAPVPGIENLPSFC